LQIAEIQQHLLTFITKINCFILLKSQGLVVLINGKITSRRCGDLKNMDMQEVQGEEQGGQQEVQEMRLQVSEAQKKGTQDKEVGLKASQSIV